MPRAHRRDLDDLRDALAHIRTLPGLTERAPGVFWLHRLPFMHFHTARPPRRVHAKKGACWGTEIVLPVGAGRAARAAFVREIRARYEACLAARGATRRRSRQ
jgi:hypothetical protein